MDKDMNTIPDKKKLISFLNLIIAWEVMNIVNVHFSMFYN